MCGICGFSGPGRETSLQKMNGALVHRGPDDEGYYADGQMNLAMRRLKVIDLEGGRQPIYNENKTIVTVYNGEIYNFRELRASLETKGHSFRTHSDTEILVHLYEEYGSACVEKLRGMFAFALWDKPRQKLLLARDRLGIKPLYYAVIGGAIVFASELKSLLRYHSISKNLNTEALHDYLTYLCVPAPATIFQGLYKLEPAEMLIWEKCSMVRQKYWDAASFLPDTSPGNVDEETLIQKLREIMAQSVKIHLVSDVPLGIFLSGGLDSASIVALARQAVTGKLKTFTIGTENRNYNEMREARFTAQFFGTEHHEHIIKPVKLNELITIQSCFDEPFADSSAIPTYYVSRFARQNATVALSGDGGDEVFGGYGNYKADLLAQKLRKIPAGLRRFAAAILPRMMRQGSWTLSPTQQALKLLKTSGIKKEYAHIFWLECFSRDTKEKIYANALRHLLERDALETYVASFKTCEGPDFLNQCMCVDLKTVLANDYLTKVDRMSMAHSLEVRVPLLDHELVAFGLSVPSRLKVKGLTTKYLLKKVMHDALPEAILNGKKRGFSIPVHQWLREDFSVLFKEFLDDQILKSRGLFEPSVVRRIEHDHLTGRADHSKELWALICLEIWYRHYMD